MKVKISTRSILISYFLFFFILTIVSFLITQIVPIGPFYVYNTTIFNLFFYMPPTIWAAIFGMGGLLIFLVFHDFKGLSTRFIYGLMLLSVLVIFAVFYGLPYLMEPNPRDGDSWYHGGTANALLSTGHFNLNEFGYQAYPSSFLVLSSLSLVSDVDIPSLLHFLPMALVMVFFVVLFVAINEISKNPKVAIVSVFVYGLSTYYLHFLFAPSLFGWILLFLLIAILAIEAQESSEFKLVSNKLKSFTIVILLLIIGIATTHPVTQFVAISLMLFFFIFRKKNMEKKLCPFIFVVVANNCNNHSVGNVFWFLLFFKRFAWFQKCVFNYCFKSLKISNSATVTSINPIGSSQLTPGSKSNIRPDPIVRALGFVFNLETAKNW